MHQPTTLLQAYQPAFSEEQVYKNMMLSFLNIHPDALNRSCRLGHFTASAWVVNQDKDKILLMHHRKLGIWIQCGGHCDGDSDLLGVALKEAQEESGLMAIKPLQPSIFDLDIHLIPSYKNEPSHYHFDVRFLFQACDTTPLVRNTESLDLRWVAPADAHHLTQERSILRMCEKSNALIEAVDKFVDNV
tara:strand:- start:60 stop:626 length:567 start_codon:yes stop_codon:yes gene_type:complete